VQKLVDDSQLLFWTILLVSSQWHPSLSYLYGSLAAPHEDLFFPVLHSAILSIETLQAILMLCCWPVPKIREILDPSWNYSGLAMNAGMQMGLHRPFVRFNLLQTDLSDTVGSEVQSAALMRKVLTWLACFNINIQWVPSTREVFDE
jgi:hypothetical protein